MLLYEGRAADLNGERVYATPRELWLDEPSIRRLLRRCGIDEAIVRGDRGEYALLCAYLAAIREDAQERTCAEATLEAAFGADIRVTDAPEELWRKMTELLTLDAAFVPHALKRLDAKEIYLPASLSLTPMAAEKENGISEIPDLTKLLDGGEMLGATSFAELMTAAREAIERFAACGAQMALLTVRERMPSGFRVKTEDADAWVKRGGKGLGEMQTEGVRARILFELLPLLRQKRMRLLLRAGMVEIGDGRIRCGFDACSFAVLAEKLGEAMPQTLLLPRSREAAESMRDLCGIFPSSCGEPAVRVLPMRDGEACRTPLSLLGRLSRIGFSEDRLE